jgi:bifunctional ADP-heptose synthase (sugar kinase/adenylyltransferase)/phosphoglycolate phosphatase-like HAD superfamily hydrolase
MKTELLKKIIKNIESVKIAVLGDFCLDAYWHIDESKSEISVETGKVTHPVRLQKYSLGGAGNVVNNLVAMGIKDVRAFGVIGSDPFGEEIMNLMKIAGIKTNNLLVQNEEWSTHVYSKPLIADVEQNRIDFGNFNILSDLTANQLIDALIDEAKEIDVIIINQQVLSGIHTEYFRQKLVKVINLFPDKIFIADSRNYNDYYNGAYRKMNANEALLLCGLKKEPNEYVPYREALKAANLLFERYQRPIFITLGSQGSLVIEESGIADIPGLMIIARTDPVGAGDSYLAGMASTLAAGYSAQTAAEMGTFVAGVTIQKLFQTGTATPEEILQIGEDPDYIYKPELAENIQEANYFEDTEIEIINSWSVKPQIKHVIFDNDGTISTLREGWELIMAPMMIKAVLGDRYGNADEVLDQKVRTRIYEFIDKTTGMLTLSQMKGLIGIIREFGFVPEEQILDELGYKRIYNEELLHMVKVREKKLMRGELSVEDFTLKNAGLLLRTLYNAGIKLYLTSGTDEEDVKNEARILGYDHIFEGGIYGSVGSITKDAKKIVLDRILGTIGKSNQGRIATFGDGPVEIRETHKRGGITIGVASNEIKRYGLNNNKRTRLIKAGADIIVPDYSQLPQLLSLLNIN